MEITSLAPLLRMVERSLIVAGGILSIYLGYALFVLGIDKSQGQASALGVTMKNFGPGLFFAALGAVILVTSMKAAIKVGEDSHLGDKPGRKESMRGARNPGTARASGAPVFFGLEDARQNGQWANTAFYLDTRLFLSRIDAGEPLDKLSDLAASLKSKLDSITMTPDEYARYQRLTGTLPLNDSEQEELLVLEAKLVP